MESICPKRPFESGEIQAPRLRTSGASSLRWVLRVAPADGAFCSILGDIVTLFMIHRGGFNNRRKARIRATYSYLLCESQTSWADFTWIQVSHSCTI